MSALPDSVVLLLTFAAALGLGEWWHRRCRPVVEVSGNVLVHPKHVQIRFLPDHEAERRRRERWLQACDELDHPAIGVDLARPGSDRTTAVPRFRAFRPTGAAN